MKRRQFITRTLSGAAWITAAGISSEVLASTTSTRRLTLLHTNDVHSHIDPFPADHSRNPNMGGAARRATLIESIRKENPNTLLLDAGDIFQGTPYFNFYGGELEFKLMSMMQYDAATLGNHDFDGGLQGLLAQLPHASFDILTANYDFSNTVLEGRFKPWKIFSKDGLRIGVFGLGIELAGLVGKKYYEETRYQDPVGVAQDVSNTLRMEEGCDLVVCLSHLGYEYKNENKVSDLILARETDHIDVIIGGHTHTFLKEPTMITNRSGRNVIVNQVGCYGLYLGRIDFLFNNEGNSFSNQIVSVQK